MKLVVLVLLVLSSFGFANNRHRPLVCTAQTIAYYDREGGARYEQRTSDADLSLQYTEFLALLPRAKQPRVLDAGCGAGRDSQYFKNQGIDVVSYDGSAAMARYASRKLGQPVFHLFFDEIAFENEFDGVWAMASLLHAPLADLPEIIERHVRALRWRGIMFMSFLSTETGKGESFSEIGPTYARGRRWLKLGRPELEKIFAQVPNIEILRISDPVADSVPGRHKITWTEAVIRRL